MASEWTVVILVLISFCDRCDVENVYPDQFSDVKYRYEIREELQKSAQDAIVGMEKSSTGIVLWYPNKFAVTK